MTAGIEDVAIRAGVSTATVSRALRGLPNVSASTRERVLAAALELDYVVSASASSLASGRTSTVAAVTPYIARWFFGQVLCGAESVLREAGFDLLVHAVGTSERRDRFFAELPLRRRVDALMILTLPLDATEVAALSALRMPVAAVGLAVPGFPSVHIDDQRGAMSAVNHLVGLGHRRIAMISGGGSEPAHFTAADDRRAGYIAALTAAGIPIEGGYDVDGGYTVRGGEAAMAVLLSRPILPTAVFAQSDEMAMGALQAIRKAGLRCPQNISVVGFDDHEVAELFDLTTVAQPVREQGAMVARHLVAALRGVVLPTSTTVATRLVIRGSTCPPKGAGEASRQREAPADAGRQVVAPAGRRRGPVPVPKGRQGAR